MGCFNDPAWKVCGWWGGGGGWLTPTTYIQLAGAGSKKESNLFPRHGLTLLHSTDGSTRQGHTLNPLCDRGAKALKA